LKKASRNKWFFIGIGFIAVFVIITAIIITSKVSEYNRSKDVVTASHFPAQYEQIVNTYDIFTQFENTPVRLGEHF